VLLTYNGEWVNVASTAETLVKRRKCCDRENLLSVVEWCGVVRSKEVEVGSRFIQRADCAVLVRVNVGERRITADHSTDLESSLSLHAYLCLPRGGCSDDIDTAC
jgi:hypothetical protein